MTEHDELCRLCAEPKDNLIGIYDAEGQKLAIDAKIAKCLQIQVLVTDTLPLNVCLDCCILLDQCNEFYDKTNQAQLSLHELLNNTKSEEISLDQNIEYLEDTENFKEDNADDRLIECEYIHFKEVKDDDLKYSNDGYFTDNHETSKTINEAQVVQEDDDKDKSYKVEKKIVVKQTKKKVKKKNQGQKLVSSGNNVQSDLDDQNNEEVKSNVKIPENYMTGSESDIQMIETCLEMPKTNRKGGEILDRYPWLCTDCDDKLPSLETLERHHETVHNQPAKFMCVQCCKVYEKYYGFLTHVKRHKIKSKFNCEDCGKSFAHKKVLESHKAVHSEERPYTCQTCGKTFRQQSALYIHSRCHLPDTVKNSFPCDQCNKRFSTKPNLVTHKRIHSGVRNFTCDQCGKSFVQKGNLEAHFLTHSVDKPYSCTQCTKAFKTPLQLKKHESVHTGAKPHQCTVCGRTFREKGTLREHHRIHTGAMPFTCEFCGKCFRFKGILTTHRRQHTGERPYSCLECQHHFTNWPNYNKHMKRRHGINTSHTKHLQQPQQQQHIQTDQVNQISQANSESNTHSIQEVSATTVQVIQAVPHVSGSQPIVVQTIPTSAIQTFPAEITTSSNVQETVFRERNATYFNTVPTALQNFLPANLPYNFYNISSVTETDLMQHR